MWLSETKRRNDNEYPDVSVQEAAGAATDVLRPANILRLPLDGEKQLIMNCTDGTVVQLGVIDDNIPTGLEAGEIYIETDNAKLTIKNNGAINIIGSVNITGSLTVNGVSI